MDRDEPGGAFPAGAADSDPPLEGPERRAGDVPGSGIDPGLTTTEEAPWGSLWWG